MSMKRLIAVLPGLKRIGAAFAVAALAAVVLLRPVPPPTPSGAAGWSSAGAPGSTSAGPPGSAKRAGLRGFASAASPARALVYVAGDVVRPGVYSVGPESRVRDALALAGGSRPDADVVAVNLAAHVRDGDEIVVPVRGAAETLPAARAAHRLGHGRGRRAGGAHRAGHGRHKRSRRDEPPPAAQVDLNSADAETLATIPGIGPGLAERIVAFRTTNGAFASVDELLDVSGITEHRLDAILPYVVAR
ncbi:MAG: ComEA family DNA-binding protein [Candidatus Eremiobacteraeota bacterium]|nr:ComEA family DNA-binding protein [Candidatus Eremiobacteraeota bacterium]